MKFLHAGTENYKLTGSKKKAAGRRAVPAPLLADREQSPVHTGSGHWLKLRSKG